MSKFTSTQLKTYLIDALGGDDEGGEITNATDSASLRGLGVDSLAIIDASNRIERDLKVKFPEGTISQLDNIGEFVQLVNSLTGAEE